jgi:outer membrane protein OmpA-like peptidoglycan-associated protein/tetratricopeptide (TPR) repeat protein
MNKPVSVLFLFIGLSLPLTGQQIVPSATDLYADANEYIFAGDYREALSILISLKEKDYNSANISYLIGECYLNIPGQRLKAIPFLREAAENKSDNWTGSTLEEEYAPQKVLLYLGIAYRLNTDFARAVAYLNDYLVTLDDTDTDSRAMVEYHIARCNNARELMQAPARFFADTLAAFINSGASSSNPLVTSDEKVLYYMNELKFYDAVMHSVKANGVWQAPENITPEIKSDGDHYLTGMTGSGKTLFLTYYDPYLSGEIYTTDMNDKGWSRLEKLTDSINTRFNESHASVSPDGKYLYFTSDRPGGYGGLDIYRSEAISKGHWGNPENLGPLINSPYNEESPFISADSKKLFFSSQGHYNMGGYDIFYSLADSSGVWLPPVNVGYPLNTTDDDLFFFPTGDGSSAYQARYAGNGTKEIIRFTIKSFGNPSRFLINGKVDFESDSGYHPEHISVAFIDKNISDTVVVKHLNSDGTYSQKLPDGRYRLDFNNERGLLLSREIDIPVYFPQNNLVINDKIKVTSPDKGDTIYIKDIRFGFDESLLSDVYKTYLDDIIYTMQKYPQLVLHLNGYTDALGNDSYNVKLSLRRANVVMNYLTTQAGLNQRIMINALGERNPVAVNVNKDGSDNSEGRSYNRRVELSFINVPANVTLRIQTDVPVDLRIR